VREGIDPRSGVAVAALDADAGRVDLDDGEPPKASSTATRR
jgi:hypothetical protein